MYNFVKITTKINDFNGHIQGRGGLYSPKGKKTRKRDIYTMTKNHGFKKTSDTVKSTLSYMRYCLAKKILICHFIKMRYKYYKNIYIVYQYQNYDICFRRKKHCWRIIAEGH